MSTTTEIEKAREHASIRDLRGFVGELVRECASLRAQLTRAREALFAADRVMWMAREYAAAGGEIGPEMYSLREAESAISRALASHPSSPEGEKP